MSLVYYTIDERSRLLTLHYGGAPTYQEWTVAMERALVDPAHQPGFSILLDRTGGIEPPSAIAITRVADFLAAHRDALGPCRMAAVVDGDVAYDLGQMLEQLNRDTSVTFQVFTDDAAARAWLGVGPGREGRD
ncbi:MAG TPA: hypothetical protein VJN95_04275 [Gemmatimonadales bacterium]|nr:hypothetical protein [Gemmatimonadales bacterium]